MDYVHQNMTSNFIPKSFKHISTKIFLKMALVEADWKIVYSLAISPYVSNASKKELFPQLVLVVTVFKGYIEFVIYKYWRIFAVTLWLKSVVLDHMPEWRTMAVTGKSAQDGLNLVCGSDHRNFLTVFTHPICIHIYHRWGDVLSVRTKPSFLKTVFSSKKNRWSHTNDYKYLFYKYV